VSLTTTLSRFEAVFYDTGDAQGTESDTLIPKNDDLSRVSADVAGCFECPRLVEWREKVAEEKRASYKNDEYWGLGVPAFGDPNAKIMIVGLAPAAHGANRTGRMFTGDRSGDWLYGALHRAGLANQPTSTDINDGLELTNVIITAPVKCAPPANKPTPTERDQCSQYFERELAIVQPTVYLVLGGFAYQTLTRYLGVRPRPRFGHGVEVCVPDSDATILCSYHVSQQNTFTGKLTTDMLDEVMDRAKQLVGMDSHETLETHKSSHPKP